MKILRIFLVSILWLSPFVANAQDDVKFHCGNDTIEINELLRSPELKGMTQAERMGFFARKFEGSASNLRESVLNAEDAPVEINVHSFNPLSLIYTCVALAEAYETSSAPNWRDYLDKLKNVAYKGGEPSDFVSRFMYGCDWIADNIFRGNVEEATTLLELPTRKKEKSIDYITHNRDKFAALKNETEFSRMQMLEMGFRNHQIPYVTTGDLINPKRFLPQAKEGDMIFLLAPDYNLDFREMGILLKDGDKVRLMQVSLPAGKVVVEDMPLEQYVKRNVKRISGARIVRIR